MRLHNILSFHIKVSTSNAVNLLHSIGFIFVILLSSSTIAQNITKEKVILQLKWKNQFQFAGYYAAVEKGYYKEVGLDVEIKELEKSATSISKVLTGEAQYGIGNSELVIDYMKGESIVVLACMMQNSPSALVVKASSNIFTPKDLVGKYIEIDKDQSGIEIMAMLSREGVKIDQANTTGTTFSLNNLLANKIDALEVYTTNEPYFLDKFGIPYRLIYPRNYGINFYADCLFTTQEEVENHPERVKEFRNASIKGWKYALDHPEEIVNIIQTKYQSTKTIEHLLFEAEEMRKLINPDFIDVGHSNKERWMNIVEILSQQGFIKQYKDINDFIYNPDDADYSSKRDFFIVIIILLTLGIISLGYFTIKFRESSSNYSAIVKILTKQNNLQKDELMRLNEEAKRLKEGVK